MRCAQLKIVKRIECRRQETSVIAVCVMRYALLNAQSQSQISYYSIPSMFGQSTKHLLRIHTSNLSYLKKRKRLISFLGLICAALLFFSTCSPPSYSGPSGPVSKNMGQSEFEWLPDIKSCATWKLAKKKRSNTCPADEISISCASPEGRTAFSIISSYCSSAAFFEILPFCPD